MAYSLILLRNDTGRPCVFHADLYGSFGSSDGRNSTPPTCRGLILPRMILARQLYAYGVQHDYFDKSNCIGFTRAGHESHSDGAGLAVIMTNGFETAQKRMNVGIHHIGELWTDLLRCCWGEVLIDSEGWGMFGVSPRSVSIWVLKTASNRRKLDGLVLSVHNFLFPLFVFFS